MEEISDFIISLLPSSPVTFLIYLAGITLFSILAILYFAKKPKEKLKKENKKKDLTLDDLIKIAKNEKSTLKDLAFTLSYFVEKFKIDDNKKKAFELFNLVLNHKNRGKLLFDIFHGQLIPANLSYKKELDELEKRALNKTD